MFGFLIILGILIAIVVALIAATGSRRRSRPKPPARPKRRRSGTWVKPEYLNGQDRRDADLGRDEFYTYVLSTDAGYYVGHTWHVGNRLSQHQRDEATSTAGTSPRLVWVSRRHYTRQDAASLEAALKHFLNHNPSRFWAITGLTP